MTDKNPNRARYAERRQAFVAIFGDPFETPEPVDGWYQRFSSRSPNRSVESKLGEGHSTANPASPSITDFYCDIDRILDLIFEGNSILANRFISTYIFGDIESPQVLTQGERNNLEQRIGKLLRARRLVPVDKYFTSLRIGRKGQ